MNRVLSTSLLLLGLLGSASGASAFTPEIQTGITDKAGIQGLRGFQSPAPRPPFDQPICSFLIDFGSGYTGQVLLKGEYYILVTPLFECSVAQGWNTVYAATREQWWSEDGGDFGQCIPEMTQKTEGVYDGTEELDPFACYAYILVQARYVSGDVQENLGVAEAIDYVESSADMWCTPGCDDYAELLQDSLDPTMPIEDWNVNPPDPTDTDGDGIPDSSDPDIDGDGVPNDEDYDPLDPDVTDPPPPDQDGDGIPDDQDPDVDGDGIPNEDDGDFTGGTGEPGDDDTGGPGNTGDGDPTTDGDDPDDEDGPRPGTDEPDPDAGPRRGSTGQRRFPAFCDQIEGIPGLCHPVTGTCVYPDTRGYPYYWDEQAFVLYIGLDDIRDVPNMLADADDEHSYWMIDYNNPRFDVWDLWVDTGVPCREEGDGGTGEEESSVTVMAAGNLDRDDMKDWFGESVAAADGRLAVTEAQSWFYAEPHVWEFEWPDVVTIEIDPADSRLPDWVRRLVAIVLVAFAFWVEGARAVARVINFSRGAND